MNNFQLYHDENNVQFDEITMMSAFFQINTLTKCMFDLYSANPVKQKSTGRHVAPRGHIIPIPSQSVFALTPECFVLSGKATTTNFIIFGLTRIWLEPTIYRTPGEQASHNTTDAVPFNYEMPEK